MDPIGRRKFIRNAGGGALPLLLSPAAFAFPGRSAWANGKEPIAINFVTDLPLRTPQEYLGDLQTALKNKGAGQDFYGAGGAVKALEEKFAALSGKEKAIFLPTGTLANNLAVKLLSGAQSKIYVQETSHLYRDEADAAQTVHGKRLVPLAAGKAAFTLAELESALAYHKSGEAFPTGTGAVSIETPVRRVDNYVYPMDELQRITGYCRKAGIKTHLDGARLHIASAWSGVPVQAYAALFDTVYFSLYKYLGSPGGAILCGSKALIDETAHWIKIMGGSIFQAWPYAAIALDRIDRIDAMWQEAKAKGEDLFRRLEAAGLAEVKTFEQGSNVHQLHLKKKVDTGKLTAYLQQEHNMMARTPGPQGFIRFFINETLLWRRNEEIIKAFEKGMAVASA
ncbi:MAG TPA: beta-eliminating lyase-related protein [Chitinophagaceae bacterium]|jgi:threonine aldolase|nr:beta-eliminating lyase-related protein [Chitinophagaceae bacterium]